MIRRCLAVVLSMTHSPVSSRFMPVHFALGRCRARGLAEGEDKDEDEE